MSERVRIVVIDDDQILLMLIEHTLTARGYRVETATDGEQGLARVKAAPPAAIVLDMMMPGLSGLQVLQTLRADAELARIPVIMLTARSGEQDIATLRQAGATDHLAKPFKPEELSARIARLTGDPQAHS